MASGILFTVQDFVKENFRSVSTLEVFLLLIEDHNTIWTPSQVSAKVRSNEAYAQDQLWELVRTGLAKTIDDSQGNIFFQSNCSERQALCKDLSEAFQRNKSSLITIIYSKKPNEPIKDLADGFLFNKKKD